MYESFDIEDESPQKEQHSPLKQRETLFTDKFSKSITRNFMHDSKQDEYRQYPIEELSPTKHETIRQKRKNRLNSKILKPLTNPERTEATRLDDMKVIAAFNVFNIQDDDIQEESSPSKLTSKQPLRHNKSEEEEDQLENVEVPSRNEANILFYEQEESDINPQPLTVEDVLLPSHNKVPRYLEEIQMSSNMSALEEVVVRGHSQYFHFQNKERLMGEIFEIVRPLHTLKMVLSRDNSGFNTFWPEFYMKFPSETLPVICAKRTTARPISTFILSMNPSDFEQNTPNYLGKIKSNAMGDVLYVYGPGYSPSNAKEKGLRQREMLATIRYQSNFFNSNRPREFEVYILRQGVKYFNLKGTKVHGDQPGLDQLFSQHEVNRDCMHIYSNRKPVWSEMAGGFMLNFKGRVPCASIKNFILDDPFGHEAVVFGRREKNEFTLELTDKISPFIAMAVSLSAFDTRIMCQ